MNLEDTIKALKELPLDDLFEECQGCNGEGTYSDWHTPKKTCEYCDGAGAILREE